MYNTFAYNPQIAQWFHSNDELPDSAVELAQSRPDLAQHINSVWSFVGWLKDTNPQLYNAITNYRPDLLDPAAVVGSGSLSPASGSTLKGMGDITDVTDNSGTAASVADVNAMNTPAPDSSIGGTLTSWGNDLMSTIKNVAPSYFQLKSQQDLMNINIQRAAQGLPPIDSSTLAPTVNVGISKDVQTLGMIAVGGLVLVGLFAAFRKGK